MSIANNHQPDVIPAFEMLLEEIEGAVERVKREGAQAIEAEQFPRAGELLHLAEQLTAIRGDVAALRERWSSLVPSPEQGEEGERGDRRNLGRLAGGTRTREEAYRMPILQALSDLGGSGPVGEVLDAVGKAMADVLRKVDYEPLSSDPESIRWRNTAQWARNTMVHDGLLRDDSKRGIWEITEKGRRELRTR